MENLKFLIYSLITIHGIFYIRISIPIINWKRHILPMLEQSDVRTRHFSNSNKSSITLYFSLRFMYHVFLGSFLDLWKTFELILKSPCDISSHMIVQKLDIIIKNWFLIVLRPFVTFINEMYSYTQRRLFLEIYWTKINFTMLI